MPMFRRAYVPIQDPLLGVADLTHIVHIFGRVLHQFNSCAQLQHTVLQATTGNFLSLSFSIQTDYTISLAQCATIERKGGL